MCTVLAFSTVVKGWLELDEVVAVVGGEFGGKFCADGVPFFCGCAVPRTAFLDVVGEDLHYIFSTKRDP